MAAVALGAGLLLSSCVTYAQPPADGSAAYVQFERNPGLSGNNSAFELMHIPAEGCGKGELVSSFVPINSGYGAIKVKEARLVAGAPLELVVQMTDLIDARTIGFCSARFRFTPEAGRRYIVRQNGTVEGPCVAEVIDAATGAAPASFRALPTPNTCVGIGRR